MVTLKDRLDANRGQGPGFHFMRHALAVLILVHHTYVLTFGGQGNIGYVKGAISSQIGNLSGKQIVIEMIRPGLYSLVGAFFVLSGFLVAGSAIRTRHPGRFLWFRLIRIAPALCVEVTLSAIVLGGLFTTLDLANYYGSGGFLGYFANIVGDVHFFLPGVFTNNPMPDIVNVNLWTLPGEFYCYVFMLAFIVTGVVLTRRKYNILFVGILALTIGAVAFLPDRFPTRFETTHYTEWFIVFAFFVGILFYLNADKIVMHGALFMASATGFWALTLFQISDIGASFLLAYCVVFIGTWNFKWFDKNISGDYSYGIYLYGYPITQAVIALLLPWLANAHGPYRFVLVAPLSLMLTFGFAYFSWNCIEKRILKFKNAVFAKKPMLGNPITAPGQSS